MAKIGSTDLALVTARVGCCRLGASRMGFTPYDVKGPGATYPCEYIWREVKPPTTQWTLVTEGVVCGKRPTALFTMTGVSVPPVPATGDITGTTYLDFENGGDEVTGVTVTIPAFGLTTVSGILGAFSFSGVPAGAVILFGNKLGALEGTNNGVVPSGGSVVISVVIFSPV